MSSDQLVATRYARAFYKLFHQNFTQDFLAQLQKLDDFFRAHKFLLLSLKMRHREEAHKKKILSKQMQTISPLEAWDALLEALAGQNRLYMIGLVVKQLQRLCMEEQKLMRGVIEVYPSLHAAEEDCLRKFFAKKTGYTLIGEVKQNPDLIAGIRIKSDTYVWERSIRKRLDAIKRLF